MWGQHSLCGWNNPIFWKSKTVKHRTVYIWFLKKWNYNLGKLTYTIFFWGGGGGICFTYKFLEDQKQERSCEFWKKILLFPILPQMSDLNPCFTSAFGKKTGKYQCCGSGIRCLFDPWIRDPVPFWPLDPRSGAFLTPGSGIRNGFFTPLFCCCFGIRDGKNQDPG